MAKGTEPAKAATAAAAAEEEVVIGVPVHCDGCARKLRRSLQSLDGVGEVSVDSRANRVVLRGQKAAENAAEAVKIVERRTGRKAVLVSPAPDKLPPPSAKSGEETKKDSGNKVVTNDLPEIDMKMVVVLRINLHCDACCEEIKRRILRIKGVEDAVPHLKSSQMMVKGVFEPATLVGFIRDCTGRKAAIFRAEPLDPLPAPKDAPPVEADEPKKNDQSEDKGENKKNGHENGKKEEPQEENKVGGGGGGGGGDEEDRADENPDGDGGNEDHQQNHGEAKKHAGDGAVVESRKKDDRLFTVPLPAGVVTVAPEVALNSVSPYYYSYPSYPYPNMYQYRYPQLYYPPYACGHAMYGYPHYPSEEFCEENPNACAIV